MRSDYEVAFLPLLPPHLLCLEHSRLERRRNMSWLWWGTMKESENTQICVTQSKHWSIMMIIITADFLGTTVWIQVPGRSQLLGSRAPPHLFVGREEYPRDHVPLLRAPSHLSYTQVQPTLPNGSHMFLWFLCNSNKGLLPMVGDLCPHRLSS